MGRLEDSQVSGASSDGGVEVVAGPYVVNQSWGKLDTSDARCNIICQPV